MSWRDTTSSAPHDGARSRALNLDLGEAEVLAACSKRSLRISAIETLLCGGTRVVMSTIDDAMKLRRVLKAKLLEGSVDRVAWASRR